MKLTCQTPAKALFPAFRIQNVESRHFERFKTELLRLLERLDHSAGESEEHLKNNVADFLKEAWYRDGHYINTRDRQDLVIHNGSTARDPVGVIIEAKKPGNKAEMISAAKPNAKALHELLRYYLNERQLAANRDIKRLVITNIEEWFLFDAADFERQIYSNAKLLKNYADWREGRLGAGNTDWFYKEIAAPFFDHDLPELTCTHFRLTDYRAPLPFGGGVGGGVADGAGVADDERLLDLYKILSPEHLLKKTFANDSNALNKPFYDELLYLLGLEEVKDGGKKLIQRADKRRHEGSLLENTLNKLDVSGKWRKAPDAGSYGDNEESIRFSIALELCITWLNRILFLKLLEGQLKRWRPDDPLSRFLRPDFIRDFDDLHELFFEVLNRPFGQRGPDVQKRYGNLPYLNSSLFEITPLEDAIFSINDLKDRTEIPLAPQTALRDTAGQRRTGRLNTLHYLLEFLDAYDFSSDGKARIQAEQRDVINAAVLGLIFEKINGYRDGSFFTPGFITMYMCRETLRRAVTQKFNAQYGWNCPDFDALYNHLDLAKIGEYNTLVNSIRLCDPAVGSGHFLVSALNELIAIKSELGILADRQGRRLRELRAVVGNDELILTDADTDRPFEYRPGIAASQRIQEALFHEKQTLIENCLFGVDINPKSVMICQLRLWIELLKHSYFILPSTGGGQGGGFAGGGGETLETLPNIDINIKCGNSLISRFALDEDLSDVFRRQKFSRADYLQAVQAYKQVRTKEGKEELRAFIRRIKDEFRQTVFNRNPFAKQLSQKRGQLVLLDNNLDLFGEARKDAATAEKERAKLTADIAALEQQLDDYKTGPLYRNSFEWRFEFPEVLDEAGAFRGFDVVVGNPPYIRQEELAAFKNHFQTAFATYAGTADLYVYFVERGMKVLAPGGQFSYILPNKWMRAGYGDRLRQFVKSFRIEAVSDFGDLPVFEEATTYPCILELQNAAPRDRFPAVNIATLDFETGLSDYLRQNGFLVNFAGLMDSGWTLTDEGVQNLLEKLRRTGKPLGEYVEGKIYYGIKTGLNEAFVIDAATRERLIAEDPKSAEVIKPFLAGRDIKRYQTPMSDKFLILFERGTTNRNRGKMEPEEWIKNTYPTIFNWLNAFEDRAKARFDKGEFWWELRACDYYPEFEKPKILYQEIMTFQSFTSENQGLYTNNKIFFIPGGALSVLAFLNSKLVWLYLNQVASKLQGGALAMQSPYVLSIPIPEIPKKESETLTTLVTRILAAKRLDPAADTSSDEAEIDRLVYGLYGLTEEEIRIVEG